MNAMNKALAAALVLTTVSGAVAQTAAPALMIKVKGRSVPLGLAKVVTDVRIHGPVAETKTTMTFRNPHDRALEGDLYFPLPQGSTVSGYALDIKGVMVDGVAVEKHRARQVFEKIVRQGIDPGLVEWTKGNNFKTRVFPIPAKGTRTIAVRYVTETAVRRGAEAVYRLPLNYRSKVEDFTLRVEVVGPAAQPKITGGRLGKMAFGKVGAGYIATAHLKNVAPGEALTISLPGSADKSVLVERGPDGGVYFAIQDTPPIPEVKSVRAMPKHVVIYWDASGSRGGRDHNREIGVLAKCLDGFLPNDKSEGFTVDLVLFRNASAPPKTFRWADGKTDKVALVKALRAVDYDGGTQIAAITPWPDAKKPDFTMLFTDGLSNFGRAEAAGLTAPVYAFADSPQTDHASLRALAMKTGGRYFNLNRMTDQQVAAAIGRSVFSFMSAHADAGKADELYPKLPQPVTGRFMLVGRLTGRDKTARVTLKYGRGGKAGPARPFDVDGRRAPTGTLLRRLWAQKKLDDLLIFPERNREQIVHLGKDHGLVTPHTSLLVLDSLEQYVEHRIAPPMSLAKMRHQYMRRIDTIAFQAKKTRAAKIGTVLAMWKGRVAWWEKEFKYPKDFRYGRPKPAKGNGGGTVSASPGSPPSSRPRGGSALRGPSSPAPRRLGLSGLSGRRRTSGNAADSAMARRNVQSQIDALRRQTAGGEGEGHALRESTGEASGGPQSANGAVRRGGGRGEGREKDVTRRGRAGIAIRAWDPKTPYLAELKSAKPQAVWGVYMKNRVKYGNSPSFFLDCADFFHGRAEIDRALQVLSNIAELELENPAMLRVLGHRLVQRRRFDLAVLTFEEVLRIRPGEPQSYRDLALALAARAEAVGSSQMLSIDPIDPGPTVAPPPAPKAPRPPRGVKHMTVADTRAIHARVRDDYARAIKLLNDVVMKHWERFPEIEVIALMELNRLIPRAKAFGLKEIPVDPRLIKVLACDVRIVMTWDADSTDIDLHVIEPSGERAYYSHNRTTIGGLVSKDFTRGYGPEEYLVRKAMHGVYTIQAKYYGSSSAKLLGAVTLRVDIFTDFGGDDEQHRSITLRLKEKKDIVPVGKIEF